MPSAHLAVDLEEALDAAPAPHLSRNDVPNRLLIAAEPSALVRMTAEEWSMIVAFWIAMALSPAWMYPAFAILLAGRFHALGVVLHDATHMPLRRKSAGIRIVEIFCGYPIASTLNAMRYHHLRHHRDSGMPTDPYYKTGRQNAAWWTLNTLRGLLLVPFWHVRALVGAIAYFAAPLRNIYAHAFLQDRTNDDLRHSPEVIECARAECGQVAFLTALIAVGIAFPEALLRGYIVPVSMAGLLAARRVLIEHTYQRVADRQVETILGATNDNYLGFAGAIGLAPRNIGYHVVHHIHPQVTLEALPLLRDWYVANRGDLYPPPRR